jgi:hypothetical protein
MISDIRTYDARLSDEREALVATLDEEPVEVRFEKITDEVDTEYDREDAWRFSEAWDFRKGMQRPIHVIEVGQIAEKLTQEGYGRFYDPDENRLPAWDPGIRNPDDELVKEHGEYVRARIREWSEMFEDEELPKRCRSLADEYDVDLPQEVEA